MKKAIRFILGMISLNVMSTKFIGWVVSTSIIVAMYLVYLYKSSDHTKAHVVFGYLCLSVGILYLLYSMHNVVEKIMLKVDPNKAFRSLNGGHVWRRENDDDEMKMTEPPAES